MNHSVTLAIKTELRKRVELFTEQLVSSAGQNPVADAKLSGLIAGYRDILDTKLEDFQEAE